MGLIAQRSGQNELARTWFDKALAASPTYAPALVNRAVVSSYFLEYGAAEEDLMTAIQSEPTNIDAYIVLAATQKKQGNLKGAKASLTKALDLDSMNPYARFNLGVLQADDLKNHSEALRLFNEVLETQMAPPALREITARYIRDLDTLRKS
jgi:tetratricopeptide (TPR) repeat protein